MRQAGHRHRMTRIADPLFVALIVAAGRGQRAGAGLPKQYRLLQGERVLTRSLRALLAEPHITSLLCVIHPDDLDLYQDCLAALSESDRARILPPAYGRASRQGSVFAGLTALARSTQQSPDYVLIHDGARPFVSRALILRGLADVKIHAASIPALSVIDTLKQVDEHGSVVSTPHRAALRAVQTPQLFRFDLIYKAHQMAQSIDGLTDDASVIEHFGHAVHVFEGEARNIKLTTEDDFKQAERDLSMPHLTLTGYGYDVHAFGPGDHVWLAGIRIAYERGIRAHSDGDVILHALCDAVFGVMGDGDIGQHFPPSDPQWKGVASSYFVAYALKKLHAKQGRLLHVDVNLVAEAPRIGPHRSAMIHALAQMLSLPPSRVGLKATTSEQLGFTGRKEGIAATVVVTVAFPDLGDHDV